MQPVVGSEGQEFHQATRLAQAPPGLSDRPGPVGNPELTQELDLQAGFFPGKHRLLFHTRQMEVAGEPARPSSSDMSIVYQAYLSRALIRQHASLAPTVQRSGREVVDMEAFKPG